MLILYALLLIILLCLPSILENFETENTTTEPKKEIDNTNINNLKNTIDIIKLQIDSIKNDMTKMNKDVSANKKKLKEYDEMVDQLQDQMEEETKKMKRKMKRKS